MLIHSRPLICQRGGSCGDCDRQGGGGGGCGDSSNKKTKMAYRRRQGITRASTFREEIYRSPEDDINNNDIKNRNMLKTSHTFSSSSSLAAQAIRASAAHRESSLSSAYAGDSSPQRSKVYKSKHYFLSLFMKLSLEIHTMVPVL